MSRWVVRKVMPDSDDEEGMDTWKTRNEAIEAVLAQADPGDSITVHLESCEPCTCKPEILTVPARSIS